MSFNEVYECEWYKYLTNLSFTLNTFVFESQMSDEEKKLNPHYVTLGGYMKTLSYKESWAKITPLHNQFMDAILQSPAHIIATVRSKQDYVLVERNGKKVPQKVGMASIQRDGVEYEFTLNFSLDQDHRAFADKDRTGLFMKDDQAPFVLSEETGKVLKKWADTGRDTTPTGEPTIDPTQLKKIHALGLALGYSNKESESRVLEYYKKSDLKEITKSQGEGMIKALTEKVKLKEAEEANKPLTDKQTDQLVEHVVQDSFIEGLERDKEAQT
jgi:hypothetical protein